MVPAGNADDRHHPHRSSAGHAAVGGSAGGAGRARRDVVFHLGERPNLPRRHPHVRQRRGCARNDALGSNGLEPANDEIRMTNDETNSNERMIECSKQTVSSI